MGIMAMSINRIISDYYANTYRHPDTLILSEYCYTMLKQENNVPIHNDIKIFCGLNIVRVPYGALILCGNAN